MVMYSAWIMVILVGLLPHGNIKFGKESRKERRLSTEFLNETIKVIEIKIQPLLTY